MSLPTLSIEAPDLHDAVPHPVDYAALLTRQGAVVMQQGDELLVGTLRNGQGWILEVSIRPIDVVPVLKSILPSLLTEKVAFRMVRNSDIAGRVLQGLTGHSALGKILSVYPASPERALAWAQLLVKATAGFAGPAIPTSYPLGNAVFARWGGYITANMTDEFGRTRRYYLNLAGTPLPEDLAIPFRLPEGVQWPFTPLRKYQTDKEASFIAGRYMVQEVLKNDLKGRVMKAAYTKGLLKVQSCIIKEGLPWMAIDAEGRDIRDKLDWQYKVGKDLEDHIQVPKVIDKVRVGDRAYLVIACVEGRSMGADIDELHQSVHWSSLDTAIRAHFQRHCLFVIDFVEKMHAKGYYHRDITSRNFLTGSDGYWGIDLELAWNFKEGRPAPAFTLGSPGYMSPEQRQAQLPTAEQDIYGLGGLLLRVFTGLSPKIFNPDIPGVMRHHLSFLMGKGMPVELVTACLHPDPAERPTLAEIRAGIERIGAGVSDQAAVRDSAEEPMVEEVQGIIQQGINALAGPRMASPEGIWFSRPHFDSRIIDNDIQETCYLLGMERGLAGILYFLATAMDAGIDIEACRPRNRAAWQYLDGQRFQGAPVVPGLYHGSAGASLAFVQGVAAGLIDPPEEMKAIILAGLTTPTEDLTLSAGLAGQGLALLQARDLFEAKETDLALAKIVAVILSRQTKEGAWSTFQPGMERPLVLSGFSYGMAGIVYFLLQYYTQTRDATVLEAAERALAHLDQQFYVPSAEGVHWKMYEGGPDAPGWLDQGVTGIVLPFIRAYSITGRHRYQELSEKTLRQHPRYLVTPYLSVLTGATGIGEVYLEAWNAFGEEEWRVRAGWVVQLLLHTYQPDADGAVCWVTDNTTLPTADLLLGNSGILLFLLRWLDPSNIRFQIFN